MKNLTKIYTKILIQKLEFIVEVFINKHQIYINNNKIGFYKELYRPNQTIYINNFCNYNHFANLYNHKLYKKYPGCVLSLDYEIWLKNYAKPFK